MYVCVRACKCHFSHNVFETPLSRQQQSSRNILARGLYCDVIGGYCVVPTEYNTHAPVSCSPWDVCMHMCSCVAFLQIYCHFLSLQSLTHESPVGVQSGFISEHFLASLRPVDMYKPIKDTNQLERSDGAACK